MQDDATLLHTYVANGSEAAFTAFVDRHFNLVYSAALRQVDGQAEAAREIAQDVFTDAARKARFLSGHPALVGWLYTSTHYAAANFRRAEQRRRQREQTAAAMDESTSPPADWSAIRPHLDAAMLRLGHRDREAILLRFFEQQPFAEIARQLGVNEPAAQMRVRRALEKLRLALGRQGVTSTATALGFAISQSAVAAAPAGLSAAVAGGALAPSAALGFVALTWNLMISSKTALASACILGLLAVGSGLYSTARARSALAAARAAEAQRAAWTTRAQAAERRLGPTHPAVLATVASSATDAPTSPTDEARSNENSAALALGREFTENPALRRALADGERAKFQLEHASLFQRLGLSAEQIDALTQAQLRARSAELDYMVATAELKHTAFIDVDHTPADFPAYQAKRHEIAAERDEAFRHVLGEADFAALREYERTAPARAVAGEVAKGALFSETPLSPPQREQLVQAIARHSADYAQGGTINLTRVAWADVLQEVTGQLAPAQVEPLRALQASRWAKTKGRP